MTHTRLSAGRIAHLGKVRQLATNFRRGSRIGMGACVLRRRGHGAFLSDAITGGFADRA
jgi:hypothetical protein